MIQGYLFQLLGRELQVKAVPIHGKDTEVLYRVMEDDIYETDQISNFVGDLQHEETDIDENGVDEKEVDEKDTAESWPFKLEL